MELQAEQSVGSGKRQMQAKAEGSFHKGRRLNWPSIVRVSRLLEVPGESQCVVTRLVGEPAESTVVYSGNALGMHRMAAF